MTDFLDIPALREEDEAAFRTQALAYFAKNPNAHSIVYAVAQYFADEAGDAVHSLGVMYPTRDPWWPHRCNYDEPPADGSWCRGCEGSGERVYWGSLDSNDGAVYAYSAFCGEYGGGEGESENHDPLLIARREPDGGVSLERVADLVCPWMDFPNAFVDREDADADDAVPPGKPEPEPVAWTQAEAAMIEKIYAEPLDDGPRRILVDHWLENSDPRGEFGALSFEGKPAGKGDRAWLGPLTAVVGYGAVEFGRGPFARRVTAYFPDEAALLKHADHREWATVESLRFAEFACGFSPAMKGLKEVFGVTKAGLDSLAAATTPWRIEKLGLIASEDTISELATAWTQCRTLPAVRTLVIENVAEDEQLAALFTAPPAAALERIELWLNTETGWNDGTAARFLEQLVALRPGLEVSVGCQASSGAKLGLVATARSGERQVSFEMRGLANLGQLGGAQQTLKGFTFGALSPKLAALSAPATHVSAVPPRPRAPLLAVPANWLSREAAEMKVRARSTTPAGWAVLGATIIALLSLLVMRLVLL